MKRFIRIMDSANSTFGMFIVLFLIYAEIRGAGAYDPVTPIDWVVAIGLAVISFIATHKMEKYLEVSAND